MLPTMNVVHWLTLLPRMPGMKLPFQGYCSDVLRRMLTTSTVPTAIRKKNRMTVTVESGVARLSVRLLLAVRKIPVAARAIAVAWRLPAPVVVVGVVRLQSVLPPRDHRRRHRRRRCRDHCYGSVCVLVRNHWKRMAMTRKRTVVERKRLSSADDFGFLGRYYCYYWRVNRT